MLDVGGRTFSRGRRRPKVLCNDAGYSTIKRVKGLLDTLRLLNLSAWVLARCSGTGRLTGKEKRVGSRKSEILGAGAKTGASHVHA